MQKLNQKTDRAIAVFVLTEVLETGAYANIALRRALADNDIDPRARAFVTDLVNETLRNLIQIDGIIAKFSNTPLDKMKPFILDLLRISICQIKFMEKIPDRAAVNEAVVLTKQFGYKNLAPFMNGVLRNITRDISSKSDIQSDAIKFSYPKWLLQKLPAWLGSEQATQNFLENSHRPPPVIAIANLHKIDGASLVNEFKNEGIDANQIDNTPFIILRQPGDITRLSTYKSGLFFIMDPGAYHAVEAIAPKQGDTIIDLCAAPGGKTFAMAGLMQNTGKIMAFDIHPHRVELINQTKKRLGLSNIFAKTWDATVLDPALVGTADAVLLDAPCTGFGTIRKHPEIKYRRTLHDILDMAALQKNMLNIAAQYVKPGGKLVYCTCTITTEENGANIRNFLHNNPNFTSESEVQLLPTHTSDAFYISLTRKSL